jgi:excisionase family DNA binding protein
MKPTTETALKAIITTDSEITPQQAAQMLSVLKGEPRAPSKLLTMRDAAARFGCTVRTVQRWCRDGELPTIKRGRLVRIPEESLYAMTAARGVK